MKTWKEVTINLNKYIEWLERQVDLYKGLLKDRLDLHKKSIRELKYLRNRLDIEEERELVQKCIDILEKIYE